MPRTRVQVVARDMVSHSRKFPLRGRISPENVFFRVQKGTLFPSWVTCWGLYRFPAIHVRSPNAFVSRYQQWRNVDAISFKRIRQGTQRSDRWFTLVHHQCTFSSSRKNGSQRRFYQVDDAPLLQSTTFLPSISAKCHEHVSRWWLATWFHIPEKFPLKYIL